MLRGSASPVLTATHHSYGRPSLSFFPSQLWGSDPPTDLHTKWLKQHVFMQGCAFAVKIATFRFATLIIRPIIIHPDFQAPKRPKFGKLLDLENFLLNFIFNIRGYRENTPYSSSEPNESDILNRQSGGEKLKYALKFHIGGTSHVILHMHNDDLALCL